MKLTFVGTASCYPTAARGTHFVNLYSEQTGGSQQVLDMDLAKNFTKSRKEKKSVNTCLCTSKASI